MTSMNILLYVPTSVSPDRAEYFQHLYPALKGVSSRFIYFNPVLDGIVDREVIHHLLTQKVKQNKIDLFFAMTGSNFLYPETLDALRSKGVLTVNFSSDNLDRPMSLKGLASHFDVSWVTEPEAVQILNDFGGNPIHIPMAANPKVFKPLKVKEKYDCSFCGAKNSSRPFYIYKLLEGTDLKMAIGGKGWATSGGTAYSRGVANPLYTIQYILGNLTFPEGRRNVYADLLNIVFEPKPSDGVQSKLAKFALPPLGFSSYVRLYSTSSVSLGFNERGNTYHLPRPVLHHRLRDFEAPMSGACYLMRRLPEMQEYFVEDKEMLFYSSPEELIEKTVYYSRPENEKIRRRIRQAARRRAVRDHTWEKRLKVLFSELQIEK